MYFLRISSCMLFSTVAMALSAETTATTSLHSPPAAAVTLGRLETRHGTILIHPGNAKDRYTVIDKTGKETAKDLSESQLQARFPALHKAVKGAVADKDLDASVLDASFFLDGSRNVPESSSKRRLKTGRD